jgi:PAS domain S-box-containing protein
MSVVIAEKGLPATGAWAGTIYAFEKSTEALYVVARGGYTTLEEDARVLSLAKFPELRSVVQGNEPAFIRTPEDLGETGRSMATRHGPRSMSWAILPLQLERRAIGMVALSFDAFQEFAEPQRELLVTLARQFGQALGRARLFETERSLRERLNAVISSIPGVVWESWTEPDAEHQRVNFVSDYVERMLGYTSEGGWLRLTSGSKLFTDDRESVAAAGIAEAQASGLPSISQFRWLRKDGRAIHVMAHSSAILDEQGRAIGMRSVNLDVTERKRPKTPFSCW